MKTTAAFAIDLQLHAQAPSGQLTSVMIGRETSFGVAVAPTVTLICDDSDFDGTNQYHERPGARKRIGRTEPATGMFMGKGMFSAEADPDTIGAILLFTCGAESIAPNVGNPTVPTGAATTLSAGVAAGVTVLPFTLATGYVAGNGFRVDAGLVTQEDFVIASVATNNITVITPAKFAHATAAAVIPAVLAYDHTFTLASPRSSFTAQVNRVLDAYNAIGNKMAQLSLQMDSKNILMLKGTTEYASEALVGSPVTPAYSTLFPFVFETAGNYGKINGVNSDADIIQFGTQINTGLITDFPRFGGGRYRGQMPEGETVVSGTMELAFETTTMERAFWGAAASSAPQSTVAAVQLAYQMLTQDAVNASVQFGLQMILGKAKLENVTIPEKAKDYLKQTVKYQAFESANQAGDDIKFVVTNASSVASI